MVSRISGTLLSAVTATGPSAAIATDRYVYFTFIIEASAITGGGTMKIQAVTPGGNWVDIDSRTISANGNTVVTVTGAFDQVRANLSARTDGTYTVSYYAAAP